MVYFLKACHGKDYSLEDLVSPLRTLQIVIRNLQPPGIRVPITVSVDPSVHILCEYLMQNGVPTQMISSSNKPPSHAFRYIDHRTAWLVLIPVHLFPKPIPMSALIRSCFRWATTDLESVFRQDLVLVIAVQGHRRHPGYLYDLLIPVCTTPFYLIAIHWYAPNTVPSDSVCAIHVCNSHSNCRIQRFPNYFGRVREEEGINSLVESIRMIRKDFQGRRLWIESNFGWTGGWEAVKLDMAVAIRH